MIYVKLNNAVTEFTTPQVLNGNHEIVIGANFEPQNLELNLSKN